MYQGTIADAAGSSPVEQPNKTTRACTSSETPLQLALGRGQQLKSPTFSTPPKNLAYHSSTSKASTRTGSYPARQVPPPLLPLTQSADGRGSTRRGCQDWAKQSKQKPAPMASTVGPRTRTRQVHCSHRKDGVQHGSDKILINVHVARRKHEGKAVASVRRSAATLTAMSPRPQPSFTGR